MKKIESLTPEQEAKLPEYRDKWLDIGLSCEPLDFEKAKVAACKAYELAGLEKPVHFYRFQSPLSAAIGVTYLKEIDKHLPENIDFNQVWAQVRAQVRAQVWDQVLDQVGDQVRAQVRAQVWDQVRAQVRDQVRAQVRDQVRAQVRDQVRAQVRAQVWDQVWAQVWDQVYGCHDANWLGFYEFFKDELNIQDAAKLNGLIDLAYHCGWWSPYANCVVFQDRPELIKFDEEKRLHCENGPAILYRDGFAVYSWHGVRIPAEWIEDKAPTAQEAIKWDNMEQRRAACEIVGWANILKELNAVSIDKNDNPFVGELLEVDIPDIGREKFLRVMCGTEREFALPVPPDMERATQAQAWLNWTTEDMYLPQVRT